MRGADLKQIFIDDFYNFWKLAAILPVYEQKIAINT